MSVWRDTSLGELIDVQHGYAFKSEYFAEDGPLRLVTPGNFLEAGGFRDRGAKQKRYDGPVDDRFVLSPGDVVVAMTEQAPGLLGSSGLIPEYGQWLHNQRIGRIKLVRDDTCLRFVYYLFNTPNVRSQIAATGTGVKVRHTAPERIRAVQVRVPSGEVQIRVAALLGSFDELITINERRIELLADLARSLYVNWFVRNPDFDGDGWTAAQLGDVATVNECSVSLPDLPDPLRYMDISSVGERRVHGFTQMSLADAPGRARRKLRDGDTIWATVRPNRRAHALILDPPPDLIASTGFAVLTPKKIPASFLFEFTSQQQFTDYLVSRATGSAYPAVRPGDFEEAPVMVPRDDVLAAFDEAVEPIHRLAHHLADQNRELAETRDLLLPRLVTGQLDISDIDLGELLTEDAA